MSRPIRAGTGTKPAKRFSARVGKTRCKRARPSLTKRSARSCEIATCEPLKPALDLNLLLVDEQPVAFNYAYHYRGYVYRLRSGFDKSWAAEGPGTVLQARMIEDCFARGDRTYDLGPGDSECKRYWHSCARASYRYTYFPVADPFAQLVRAKRSVERLFRWGGLPAGKA